MNLENHKDDRFERALQDVAKSCNQLLRRCQSIEEIGSGHDPMGPVMSRTRGVIKHLEGAVQSLSSFMLGKGEDSSRMKIERVKLANGSERVVVRCVSNLMSEGELPDLGEIDEQAVVNSARKGLQGFSWAVNVTELLSFLATYQKTGALEVSTLEETFTLGLEGGEISYAFTDNSPRGLRLGDILIDQGAIRHRELEAFIDNARDGAKRLGEGLLKEEFVTREQLQAALEYQIQQLFGRLFAASDATFSFYEGQASPVFGVRMSVTQLLLESAKAQDDRDSDRQFDF